MARRRKTGRGREPEPAAGAGKAKPLPQATTSLGLLLKAAGLANAPTPRAVSISPKPAVVATVSTAKPAPRAVPPTHSPAAELRMLNDAYAGARPLAPKAARTMPSRPPSQRQELIEAERAEEVAARARLAALVAGGVRFKIVRDDDYVQGHRIDASPKLLVRLSARAFAPDATLDLHGQRAARVSDVVASFVRGHHRRGARQLLIITGKGLHSQDGVGVLLSVLIDALTAGLAAPLVSAFTTAHTTHGGTGALAVLLS